VENLTTSVYCVLESCQIPLGYLLIFYLLAFKNLILEFNPAGAKKSFPKPSRPDRNGMREKRWLPKTGLYA